MRRHSWERISQLCKVLSRIMKISHWNRCYVTAQLVNNQDEINGLDKILWRKDSWTRLSLIDDGIVINFQRTKVYVFLDSVLCFGKVLQHLESNEAWKNRVAGVRSEKSYRDFDAISGELPEFEWRSSQDSLRCSPVIKSSIYWAIWDKHQKLSQEEFSLCQWSMTSLVTAKTKKMNVWQMPNLWRYLREDLVLGNGHLLDHVLRRSGILPRTVPKEPGTTLRSKCCWNLQKVDILFSVQRPHCQWGILKSKGRGKLSFHFAADQDTIDTIYGIILSVNQLSFYGAVAAVCEEFEGHQDRSEERVILMGQSIVLGEVKVEDPLYNENPTNDQIIWQLCIQQVESLSLEYKVSKFCKEAGFMRVVEVGQ